MRCAHVGRTAVAVAAAGPQPRRDARGARPGRRRRRGGARARATFAFLARAARSLLTHTEERAAAKERRDECGDADAW